MNTKLRFYRGTKGMGILIAVTYGKDRIIFDFGAPFEPLSDPYDGTVRMRHENSLLDALLLEKILPIEGIFAGKDLKDYPLLSKEESDLNTAVFICHLHLDHMSEIDKVAEDVPVYIHEDGLKLLECLDVIHDAPEHRPYSAFRYHETIEVGDIKITPYYSDHPCPGSAGFSIITPDAKIYYSGDIRFHGSNAEKAFEELETLRDIGFDLLIVDSTTTSPSEFHLGDMSRVYDQPDRRMLEGEVSEQDIYDDIFSVLKDSKALGIFNQYDRDVSMMLSMICLSERLDRKIVFEPSFAYILKKLKGIDVPVFIPESLSSPSYLHELKDSEVITKEMIRNDPSGYLLQNSYPNILSLTDFEGLKARYFHLFGEPLVKGEKHYQIMLNVLNKLDFDFHSWSNLYSFSHAYPNQLAYMVEKIDAKAVVAVHSKHPENLNPVNSRQYFPDDVSEYLLKDGELIKL